MAPAEKTTIAVTASTMFFIIGLCSFQRKTATSINVHVAKAVSFERAAASKKS